MKILYCDEDIIVCIKPSGAVSTDEPGGMPELIRRTIGEEREVRTVHRLDSVVSGLMVYALTKEAASGLSDQIAEGTFVKEYMAVLEGRPEKDGDELHDYLWRNKRERKTFVVDKQGRNAQEAILRYKTCAKTSQLSLVRVKLITGRTHQIRAQFSSRHLPLYGDKKYGSVNSDARIALWSCHLSFRHPISGKTMDISAKPPARIPWTSFKGFTERYEEQDLVVEFQRSSSFSDCPYAEDCGFCSYQGMEYEKQLEKKQRKCTRWVRDCGDVEPMIGIEDPFHYRNKVVVSFGIDKNGRTITGIYSKAARRVIRLGRCRIDHPKAGEITASFRRLMEEQDIHPYDEKEKSGWLRQMVIRISFSEEVLLSIEAVSEATDREKAFLGALLAVHPEIRTIVLGISPDLSSSKKKGKKSGRSISREPIVFYGHGYIEDELCGRPFRLDARSFFPLNPVQTEKVYQKAIEYAEIQKDERVLDVYCGAGILSFQAAAQAKRVLAVDHPKSEIREAGERMKAEGIDNIRFISSEPEAYIEALARSHESIDVLLFQTSRCRDMGRCMEAIGNLQPRRMVYISTDPERMGQDLAYMTQLGYSVEKIQPVDVLPFTEYAETVVLLSKNELSGGRG